MRWQQQPFQREWLDACQIEHKIHIEAFREAAKTEQVSIGNSIWRLGKDSNVRIKVVSADDDLAKKIVHAAGEHIRKNTLVREVFPNLRPSQDNPWNTEQLFIQRDRITKDASLEAYGVLSSGVGGRCDILIFDDVCNFRNTILQPSMKSIVREAIMSVWMKLVEPEGQIIWLDTPWDFDDASAMVREFTDFVHLKHPVYTLVRDKQTGEMRETSRWPEKYKDEFLANEEKQRPGPFRTQMRLEPFSARGQKYFPKAVIEGCKVHGLPGLGEAEPGHVYVTFWDLGRHVNKKGRNASVRITLDITSMPAYIRSAAAYENVPYNDPDPNVFSISSEITRVSKLYRGETVLESNMAGEAIAEGLPIAVSLWRTTPANKVPMMQNALNSMSEGEVGWAPNDDLADLESQLETYTLQDDNIPQDWVIAFAGACMYVSSGGGSGIII